MYQHILVPVALDHDHTPQEAMRLARAILADGGRITALHVLEPVPALVTQYLPPDHRSDRQDNALRRMHEALAEAGAPGEIGTVVAHGHAGRAICDHAGENDVDLIVVASHRPGLQDYFLGSTAARVVRHAQCAVHVLR